jgi:hypothetical protein
MYWYHYVFVYIIVGIIYSIVSLIKDPHAINKIVAEILLIDHPIFINADPKVIFNLCAAIYFLFDVFFWPYAVFTDLKKISK